MRPLDSSLIPGDGGLVLLTARDLADDSVLMAADFRDMDALVYRPTGSYVGIGATGVRLGKRPIEMTNGVWTMREDEGLRKAHSDVRLSAALLSLEIIR